MNYTCALVILTDEHEEGTRPDLKPDLKNVKYT